VLVGQNQLDSREKGAGKVGVFLRFALFIDPYLYRGFD
jgi:hypothetical protein